MKFHKWFKNNISALNDILLRSRNIDENGKVAYRRAYMFDEVVEIIRTGISSNHSFTEDLFRVSIKQALLEPNLTLPLELSKFEKILKNKIERQKGCEKKYVVLSGFYLEGCFPFKKLKLGDATITFYTANATENKSLRRFLREQDNLLKDKFEAPSQIMTDDENQIITKIFIKARSQEEAVRKGLERLDQLRGLLNYLLNRLKFNQMTFGNKFRPQVFNEVAGFHYHTLHDYSGEIYSDSIYIEEYWEKPVKIAKFSATHEEALVKAIKRLKSNHGLNNKAWDALGVYCRALDIPGYENAFSKLWATIEYLSGVLPTESHEKIVSRTAFLSSNQQYARLLLHHLKATRNDLVHTGKELSPRTKEVVIYQLNRFVCQLMKFYIYNTLNFSNVEEFILFLDHPVDLAQLETKVNVAKKAMDFRKP